jgi:hypothetical protein
MARVEPAAHPGTGHPDARRAQLLEQLALVLQRQQARLEAALGERRQEDRPAALGATDAEVLREKQRADHEPVPRTRPVRKAGLVAI